MEAEEGKRSWAAACWHLCEILQQLGSFEADSSKHWQRSRSLWFQVEEDRSWRMARQNCPGDSSMDL